MSTPAVTAEEILRTLENGKFSPIFKDSGQLVGRGEKVWDDICTALGNRIKKHHLYESIRQDRHKLLTNLMSIFNIPAQVAPDFVIGESGAEDDGSEGCDSTDQEDDSDYDEDGPITNPHGCEKIICNLVLNEKEWSSIRPELIRYRDEREYYMMKPHWTDLIASKLHKEYKLPCSYDFKQQKFYKSQEFPFFKITGYCPDPGCRNFISGKCSRDFCIDSQTVTISIETFNTRGIVGHKKKRPVAGLKRIKLREKLKYATAACHRNEMGNEILEYSDVEPGYLETSMISRKIRQEAIDQALNLFGPKDHFESLLFLQKNGFPEIRFISQDPFLVLFYTDEQLDFIIDLARRGLLKVCIDASGGFAKILEIFGRKTGHLFFYVMVASYDGKVVPLWQMVSEAHDANTIKCALKHPLTSTTHEIPVPEEVVCDGSLALLNGASLAYNNCTIKTHMSRCFKYVTGKSTTLDPCRIRQDRAHIIHAATNWKPLKHLQPMVKDFFVRCIGYCVQEDSLDVIEDVLITMFVVSHSTVHNPNSIFDDRLAFMRKKLKDYNIETFITNDNQSEEESASLPSGEIDILEDSLEFREILSDDSIRRFLQDAFDKAMTQCSDDEEDLVEIPNEFYCPGIKNNLFYLFAQFTLWTNVMNTAYKCEGAAVSAYVEALFKNYSLCTFLRFPVSVNRFTLGGIQIANGSVKLAKANMKNKELLRENSKVPEIPAVAKPKNKVRYEGESLPSIEPSRLVNKSQTDTSNINQMNVENQPQVDSQHSSAGANSVVLKNGLRQGPMLIRGVQRKYINTCAFDSFTEVLTTAFDLNPGIASFFDSRRGSQYIQTLTRYINEENYTADNMYRDRNRLLHDGAFRITDTEVDCQVALPDLILRLIRANDEETLIVRSTMCGCGNDIRDLNDIMMMVGDISSLITDDPQRGLKNLQNCADAYFNSKQKECRMCDGPKWIKNNINSPMLIIDVQHLFMSGQGVNIQSAPPDNLTVDEMPYELFGCVESDTNYSLMHYVAYIKVRGKWLRKNDLRDDVREYDVLPHNLKISVLFYVRNVQ
ncbi:hypothetical protein QAD02_007905 [Eretmocerus hayati]|uniref:Uncharacterized protein n=1 Tax=Eretmocerus hayati TaxID=131215 RepID=A0ACC2N6A1_9HYME|nr:hypothetical protein QAD02_007905 [Eretmocerus hayati]